MREDGVPELAAAAIELPLVGVLEHLLRTRRHTSFASGMLSLAAAKGHAEVVSLLTRFVTKAFLDSSPTGPPLILAIANRHVEVVRVLLERKASPSVNDNDERHTSALQLARDSPAITALLKAAVREMGSGTDDDVIEEVVSGQGADEVVEPTTPSNSLYSSKEELAALVQPNFALVDPTPERRQSPDTPSKLPQSPSIDQMSVSKELAALSVTELQPAPTSMTVAAVLETRHAQHSPSESELLAAPPHTTFERDHTVLKAEHDKLHDAHTTLERDHAALKAEHDKLHDAHTTLERDHTALKVEHGKLQDTHTTLERDHTALKAEHGKLHDAHTTLERDHTALKAQHQQQQHDLHRLQHEYELLQRECAKLKQQLDAANARTSRAETHTVVSSTSAPTLGPTAPSLTLRSGRIVRVLSVSSHVLAATLAGIHVLMADDDESFTLLDDPAVLRDARGTVLPPGPVLALGHLRSSDERSAGLVAVSRASELLIYRTVHGSIDLEHRRSIRLATANLTVAPCALEFDYQGRLAACDPEAGRVVVLAQVDSSATVVLSLRPARVQSYRPIDVACSPAPSEASLTSRSHVPMQPPAFFVLDAASRQVLSFDGMGQSTGSFEGRPRFSEPCAIAVDRHTGFLYIADRERREVQVCRPDFSPAQRTIVLNYQPTSLAIVRGLTSNPNLSRLAIVDQEGVLHFEALSL